MLTNKKQMRKLQKKIINNRKNRNWPSAYDLSKTSLGILEEAGEFEKARKTENIDEMIDALGDIMVFCLGGFEILDTDGLDVVCKIIEENETREHSGYH